jgi:hypothetical protein
MIYIYVLLLEVNKFYIGKTNNPDIRIDNHFNQIGSKWTKLYKPIKILEIIPNCDPYDEDKYTLKYMEKNGINNVRGGSFCQIELSKEQIKMLDSMIKSSTDKCYCCGRSGHFVKDCIQKKFSKFLNDEKDIQDKINVVNSIYEKILELNYLIEKTDIIEISDLPQIREQAKNMKKINELQYILRKLNIKGNDKNQVRDIQQQLQKLTTFSYRFSELIPIYHQCINNDQKNYNKDLSILGLEIIDFNMDKRRQLKEIYKTYYDEDCIIGLLTQLYEKKIET